MCADEEIGDICWNLYIKYINRGNRMYQFFVNPEQIDIEQRKVIITGSDVNHMINVLRMKPEEEFAVSNGVDGREYRCSILSHTEDQVLCELRFIKESDIELSARVHLFQGLPKADKMELIIQKAVELGVYEIIPVAMSRCVVKLDAKKEAGKISRWNAISEAAAKQSKRNVIPQVSHVLTLKEAFEKASTMNVRLIPYELAEGMEQTRQMIASIQPGQDVAVFIGPEGGFADEEIREALACGMTPVTLGKRILRTETAGFTIMAWIMYHLEDD